nr:MAG TPA: protein of unknown function (DUF3560) [Caudoviricetes sp.]
MYFWQSATRSTKKEKITNIKNIRAMNTYYKFAPNVFLAKCDEKHEKGEVIEVTTKYGKENESIVFNLIFERDGFYYYSIVRADGFNVQEWAKRRAERRREWSVSANKKSHEYFEKSNKDRDFLSLGEPIKVGHHSERRHRKAIADAWRNMGKSVEFSDKATEHEREAEYWDKRATTINLSMPESIDFYAHKLEEAKEYHEGVKSGKYPREHSYTLTYAKKAVNEAQKNYDLAVKLWGE